MVKSKKSIFEVDTGWFKGRDRKSYRIIANNKVRSMPEIIMIKNGKLQD